MGEDLSMDWIDATPLEERMKPVGDMEDIARRYDERAQEAMDAGRFEAAIALRNAATDMRGIVAYARSLDLAESSQIATEADKILTPEGRRQEYEGRFTEERPPLDDAPWQCDMHPTERWPQKMNSTHWNPRPEYEQDPKQYGMRGMWA